MKSLGFSLTPRSRVLPEKLTGPQLVKYSLSRPSRYIKEEGYTSTHSNSSNIDII